jgi:hypothetical protein
MIRRRSFGLMSASALLAATAARGARASVTADQAQLLKTTLTPMGSERAGNADGSIPAWTGGMSTLPPGVDPNAMMPDFFADEKPILTIDQSNYAQYANRLSDGVIALIKSRGFSLNVYPTHRTACLPQWVYDNNYQNALNATPHPQGIRFGFSGAYGGSPFPIPSEGDSKGGQILWNHLCRWQGPNYNCVASSFIVNGGSPALASTLQVYQSYPYYDQNGSLTNFDGWYSHLRVNYVGPPTLDGQQLIQYNATQPLEQPQESWQLLEGQGRVRKAPELGYDTPALPFDGMGNYDEFYGFYGSPDRYIAKFVEKKEFYIPYNNNAMCLQNPFDLLKPAFVDPAHTRWELHRVWVVDLTLAPGARNVLPHRRLYVDEDTWTVGIADEWDAQGNIWRMSMVFNYVVPTLPGTIYGTLALYDLQTGQYVLNNSPYADPKYGTPPNFQPNAASQFNPNALAAQSQF